MSGDNVIPKLLQVVNVSPLDNDAGYLNEKLTAGNNISFSFTDPDGNGNLRYQIAAFENVTQDLSNPPGTDAIPNFAWGDGALDSITATGLGNIAIGKDNLAANTTGDYNIALGNNVLSDVSNTLSTRNVCLGEDIGQDAPYFTENVLIGFRVLSDSTRQALQNVIIGANALENIKNTVDINENVLIGYYVCANGNFDGNSNVIIGAYSDFANNNAQTDSVIIGYNNFPDITAANPGWCVGTRGVKQYVHEGANAAMGQNTLVAGTVTVNNTRVTANSRIFLTNNNPGGTVGTPYISARVAGTSFTITSTSGADTSEIAWEIKEPA